VGYYVTVLTPTEACVPVSELTKAIEDKGLDAVIKITDGQGADWSHLEVSTEGDGDDDERALLDVFRHVVRPGSRDDHIQSHLDAIEDGRPPSAVPWLKAYLRRVRTIYTFEVLDLRDDADDWETLWALQGAVLEIAGGIIQTDGEGYSNDAHDHILWQFADGAEGPWRMAVLDESARWQRFEMELSDVEARDAFREGRVPATAKRL